MQNTEQEHRWHKFAALLAFAAALLVLPTAQYLLKNGQSSLSEQGQVAGVSTGMPTSSAASCEQDRQDSLNSLENAYNQGQQQLLADYEKAVNPYEAAKPVVTGSNAVKAQEEAALDRLIADAYQDYQKKVDTLNAQYESLRQQVSAKSCG